MAKKNKTMNTDVRLKTAVRVVDTRQKQIDDAVKRAMGVPITENTD